MDLNAATSEAYWQKLELILQRQNENSTTKANSKNHPLSLSIITIALLMNFVGCFLWFMY